MMSKQNFSGFFRWTLLVLLLALPAASWAARNFSVAATTNGALDNYSAKATLTVDPADNGKTGVVYVAAWATGSWCFLDATGAWQSWNGGTLPAFQKGPLGSHTASLIAASDARPLSGAEFYMAYGIDEADMVSSGAFKKALVVGQTDTVTIEGTIYIKGTTTPLKGALVGTSLDATTVLTDASGHFLLKTGVAATGSTTPYTLKISATDYLTLSLSNISGDHLSGQTYYLSQTTTVSTNPLLGMWKFAQASTGTQYSRMNMLFADSKLMIGMENNCTFIANYVITNDKLTMTTSVNIPDAGSCPGNLPGSVREAKFRVASGQLTMTSFAGDSFIFNSLNVSPSTSGSWTRIYTSDSLSTLTTSFVMDTLGNVTETTGQCVVKTFVNSTRRADNPVVFDWEVTFKGDNGLCLRSVPVGQKETGMVVSIDDMLFTWSARGTRVFRKTP